MQESRGLAFSVERLADRGENVNIKNQRSKLHIKMQNGFYHPDRSGFRVAKLDTEPTERRKNKVSRKGAKTQRGKKE